VTGSGPAWLSRSLKPIFGQNCEDAFSSRPAVPWPSLQREVAGHHFAQQCALPTSEISFGGLVEQPVSLLCCFNWETELCACASLVECGLQGDD